MTRLGLIATVCLIAGLATLFEWSWPGPATRDAIALRSPRARDVRLLVAAPQGLILIDVYVTLEGVPLEDVCRQALARAVAVGEARGDSPAWWADIDFDSLVGQRASFPGGSRIHGTVRSEFTVRYDSNGNGRIERDEAERVARDLPAILFGSEHRHTRVKGMTPDLFCCLNTDRNGLLSPTELPQATEQLKRRDLNFNDLLESRECGAMDPFHEFLELEVRNQPRHLPEPPAILGLAGQVAVDEELERFLAQAYHGGRWQRSSRVHGSSFPGLLLASIDVNGSFLIEPRELPAIRNADCHLELEVDFSSSTRPTMMSVRWATPGLAARLRTNLGRVEFELPGCLVAIDCTNAPPQFAPCAERAQKVVKQYDKNGDGHLSAREQEEFPFTSLDENRDGKASVAEIRAYLEREQAAAGCRIGLTTSDFPLRTIAALDASRDQQLSLREMQNAPRRLLSFDTDFNGVIGPEEIPRTTLATIGRGDPRKSQPVEYPMPAEDWFHRMDRNRDGDVSRREFLGSRAQFERLDIDQDGLVSRAEASRALR